MLKLKNISFARTKVIVDAVSLSLKSGSFFAIVGPSGEGKSSLLKIIAGLLDADKGEVFVGKEKILGPKDKLIPGNPQIQLLNQDFALDMYHTVYENLRLKTTHLSEVIREEYIAELLDLIELSELKNQKAIELSGGEQQRLALARALALEPTVLLLDEPFAHLDAHIKRKISTYLLELKKQRKTILILVSHDGQEVLHLAEKIAFFKEGKFQRIGTAQDFYNFPTNYEEGLFFGELNKIKVQRKELIFRPNQFSIEQKENTIELNLEFKKEVFFGAFTYGFYHYKKTPIYLLKINEVELNQISTIFVNQ